MQPRRRTWLWVLGWLFVFPLPLTIIILQRKPFNQVVRVIIILAAWLLYAVIMYVTDHEDDGLYNSPHIRGGSTVISQTVSEF